MTGLLGIIAGVAAVLAVVVTSLFIGACLSVARITGAVRGRGQRRAAAERDPRSAMPRSAGGRRRDASGEPATPRRGGR